MKKFVIYIFTLVFAGALAGCSCSGPSDEAVALQTAKTYYDQLLQGDYESFLNGSCGYDSVPGYYRQQLIENMKQFIAVQNKEHGGIDSVGVLRATLDTVQKVVVANAFLKLCYADSTQEEVVVPMVKRNEVWYMR